jgi:hypothetical protein
MVDWHLGIEKELDCPSGVRVIGAVATGTGGRMDMIEEDIVAVGEGWIWSFL